MKKSESVLEACKYWIKRTHPTVVTARSFNTTLGKYKREYPILVRMKVQSLKDSIGMYREVDEIKDVAQAILLVIKELNKRY